MNKIGSNKDRKTVDYFAGSGLAMMGKSIQNPAKPKSKSKNIILKIVLFIWLILTISTVVSVVQEKIEMDKSIEVTAIVTDCTIKETYNEDSGTTSVDYITSVRWILDKNYEGKIALNQRYKEGDYITINISSEDNSKIVSNISGVASSIFVIACASLSVLIAIIVVHEQISK